MKRKTWLAEAGLCLLMAAALLCLGSQCSPLYPINVWDDANCLLTVGRAMRSGAVLYRDIYEQKGPTLYLIQMFAACISDKSFLGVYILEALSFAAMLFAACRMLARRMRESAALGCAVLLGAFILIGKAFSRGNSAEEFCLPLLMGALWIVDDAYKDGKPMARGLLFVCGLLAGLVATIKFTILGLFIGLCIAEGVAALKCGGMRRAIKSAAVFLAGMLTPVVLWAAYFAAHGALGDACTAYLYNNIFLYNDESRGIASMIRSFVQAIEGNPFWAALAGLGVAALCLDRKQHPMQRFAVLAMAACTLLTVFVLGRVWTYCPLILSVFGVYGFAALARLPLRLSGKKAMALGAGLCAAALLCVQMLSPNAYLRGVKLDELAQGRLEKFVHPGDTVLQYSHLDDGFYMVTGTLPQEKYFCRLNVDYDEMRAELDRYLAEGLPDYVLSTWDEIPEKFRDKYQLIQKDAGYDDRDRVNKMFYLYRRR